MPRSVPGICESLVNICEWCLASEDSTGHGASLQEEQCLPRVPAPRLLSLWPGTDGLGSVFIPFLASHQPYASFWVWVPGVIVCQFLSVIVSPLMSVVYGRGLCVIFGSPASGGVLVHESEGKAEIDEQSVRQEGVGQNLRLAHG